MCLVLDLRMEPNALVHLCVVKNAEILVVKMEYLEFVPIKQLLLTDV